MLPGSLGKKLSPGWVGGSREEFRSIRGMIDHWELIEKREEEENGTEEIKRGGMRRGSSKKMKRLLERFEDAR